MTDLQRAIYAKTFMIFVAGALVAHRFGADLGLAVFFLGQGLRPIYQISKE